jgi:SAM-dependent methyltransferase
MATVCHETPDMDSSSDAYALRFDGPAGGYLLGVQMDIVLELLRPWPGAQVLDVGGGHAQLAAPLLSAGYDVTVLASCDAALHRLRRIAPAAGPAVGDLCEPPFHDRSFDIVVALRMMAHVRDWVRLVAGTCRVARHAVVVDFPTPASMNALTPLLFGAKQRCEPGTRRFAMMTCGEVRRAFRNGGFRSDVERPQFFWPMVLHRLLNRPELSRRMEKAAEQVLLRRLLGSPVIMRAVRDS